MAEKNVVAISFPEKSKAYEALTVLKNLNVEGGISLDTAVVVARDAQGTVTLPDGQDNVTGVGIVSGGLIGMFIGLLGGPLGMLLGWGAGALIGGAVDADRISDADDVVAEFTKALPTDSTAVIAEVTESSEAILDSAVTAIGSAVIVRRPAIEVLAELEAAQEAAEAAAKEARRVVREQKREERKEKLEERVEALKAKLRIDKN